MIMSQVKPHDIRRRLKKVQEIFQEEGYIVKVNENDLSLIFDSDTLMSIIKDYIPQSMLRYVELKKYPDKVVLKFKIEEIAMSGYR